jgi:murein DD-endopeptidase MepM/ murein hydrolase activator NlpD
VVSRKVLSLTVALAAAVPSSSPAWAADGGGASHSAGNGGTAVGRHHAKKRRGPLLESFKLTRPHLFLYGHPARVTLRIAHGPVSVRLRLVPQAKGRPVRSIPLGRLASGTHSFSLTGTESGLLPQGSYVLRVAGRGLHRAAHASSSAALSFFHHRFPLAGPFTFGGAGARFGVGRPGHTHQGQDLPAAEGTPIVAPRAGVIETVGYQASAAGNYAVLDGDGERFDYVFMHMKTGSVVVKQGQHVRTGQHIGDVGSTGDATGPHLHFEVWDGPWYDGGHPIDPLPLLKAWAAWS